MSEIQSDSRKIHDGAQSPNRQVRDRQPMETSTVQCCETSISGIEQTIPPPLRLPLVRRQCGHSVKTCLVVRRQELPRPTDSLVFTILAN